MMIKDLKRNKTGFSLIELIVVIAILAVMVLVLAPKLLSYNERSRAEKDNSSMDEVVNAIQLALTDQEIYDEVLRFSTVDNVSCYVDTNSESNYSKIVTKANPDGIDQYTFLSDARTLDETPYFAAGNMRGVTITFAPDKGSNGSMFDLKQGVVNQYIQVSGNQRFGALPKLYNRVRSSVGDEIFNTSQTYRNSEYTVFIVMGTIGGNDESAQDATKLYGQWSGTNLPAVVSYQLVTDRVVGDTGNAIVDIDDNKWNQENGNKQTLRPGDLNGGGAFTPTTNDGNEEKPVMNSRVNEEAGLYDASGNLLIKWADTTIDIEKDRTADETSYSHWKSLYPNTKRVVVPDGITKLGKSAFEQAGVDEVVLPDGLLEISDKAFFLASVKTVDFPESVKSIGIQAFALCPLTTVNLPNALVSLGGQAFTMCTNMKTIAIGPNLQELGENVFAMCDGLESITVSSSNSHFVSTSGVLFDQNKTKIIRYPSNKSGTSYSVPSTVKTIGNNAFARSKNLTSISLPTNLTMIESYSFQNCTKLKNITIPRKVTAIGEGAFQFCENMTYVTLQSGLKTIESEAFLCCEKLSSVSIPSTVTDIGQSAFKQCDALTSVSLNSGLKTIGQWAFDMTNVSTFTIPTTVTRIEYAAFASYQVSSLKIKYNGRTYYMSPPNASYYMIWELDDLLKSKGILVGSTLV